MINQQKLIQDRYKLYRCIESLCKEFYDTKIKELDQASAESYFGKLWHKLGDLFAGQHWDNGEFRSTEFDDNLNAIERSTFDVDEYYNTHVARGRRSHEITRPLTKEEEMLGKIKGE